MTQFEILLNHFTPEEISKMDDKNKKQIERDIRLEMGILELEKRNPEAVNGYI